MPIKYVNSAGNPIELTCTRAEFAEFDDAEETDYLPAPHGLIGYESKDVLTLPFWSLRFGPASMPLMSGVSRPEVGTSDWIPPG